MTSKSSQHHHYHPSLQAPLWSSAAGPKQPQLPSLLPSNKVGHLTEHHLQKLENVEANSYEGKVPNSPNSSCNTNNVTPDHASGAAGNFNKQS